MNIRNHFPTEELQKRDAAHHLHPFTAQHDLANKGMSQYFDKKMSSAFTLKEKILMIVVYY